MRYIASERVFMSRRLRLAMLIAVMLLSVLVIVGALLLRPYTADATALAALQTSATVTITRSDGLIRLLPSTPATTGFIYYPGGLVAPDAYAAKMRAIAERGYAVFIVEMPLNLAVLGADRATEVIAANPQITTWAIGGHSLGGAMACRYVVTAKPATLRALILHASFCDQSFSLAGRDDVQVTSIYGTRDAFSTATMLETTRQYAPASTVYVAIEGANHAQFGNYGEQRGDGTPSLSADEAQQAIVEATLAALAKLKATP
jgi:dienelactone hydrolase